MQKNSDMRDTSFRENFLNIWNYFISAKSEKQLLAQFRRGILEVFDSRSFYLCMFNPRSDTIKALSKRYLTKDKLPERCLSEEAREEYFSLLDANRIKYRKFRKGILFPIFTPDQWIGHIEVKLSALKVLEETEKMFFFSSLISHAAILIEQERILKAAKNQNRNLKRLLDISKKVSSSLNLDAVLDLIIETIQDIISFDAGGIFLINHDHQTFYARKSVGYSEGSIKNIKLKLQQGIIGKAIREKRTFILGEATKHKDYFPLRKETKAQLTTPLFVGDSVIGVFSLESDRINHFHKQDIDYLKAFAGIAAIAIRNAKLYHDSVIKAELESEMVNAAQVQKALLPVNYPVPEGYDIHAVSIPSLQVGGDIYDLGGKADDYQITIGDVSGKGASGAILMAVLLAGLRSITGQRKGVSETTFSLNNLMVDSTIPGKFATFFFGKLNALKNTFVYTNAGHNYPILLRADGSVEYLERGGTVLGFIRDTPYLETETELFPNDILVLYTDGLTEAYSEKDGEYEMERLERIIKKHSRESAYQIANSILVDVKNFIRPNKLQDDLTIIVLKKC